MENGDSTQIAPFNLRAARIIVVRRYADLRAHRELYAFTVIPGQMVEPWLLQLAVGGSTSSRVGDADRLQLYLRINNVQQEEHHGIAAAFDKHKNAILPVLVKGTVQK